MYGSSGYNSLCAVAVPPLPGDLMYGHSCANHILAIPVPGVVRDEHRLNPGRPDDAFKGTEPAVEL